MARKTIYRHGPWRFEKPVRLEDKSGSYMRPAKFAARTEVFFKGSKVPVRGSDTPSDTPEAVANLQIGILSILIKFGGEELLLEDIADEVHTLFRMSFSEERILRMIGTLGNELGRLGHSEKFRGIERYIEVQDGIVVLNTEPSMLALPAPRKGAVGKRQSPRYKVNPLRLTFEQAVASDGSKSNPLWFYDVSESDGTDHIFFNDRRVHIENPDAVDLLVTFLSAGETAINQYDLLDSFGVNDYAELKEIFEDLIRELKDQNLNVAAGHIEQIQEALREEPPVILHGFSKVLESA